MDYTDFIKNATDDQLTEIADFVDYMNIEK